MAGRQTGARNPDNKPYQRNGRRLLPLQGFRVGGGGGALCVYKDMDTGEMCAHAAGDGEYWNEGVPPLYGYFDASLSWDDLVTQLADRYDAMRAGRWHFVPSSQRRRVILKPEP
jgi:hypothetical protein